MKSYLALRKSEFAWTSLFLIWLKSKEFRTPTSNRSWAYSKETSRASKERLVAS